MVGCLMEASCLLVSYRPLAISGCKRKNARQRSVSDICEQSRSAEPVPVQCLQNLWFANSCAHVFDHCSLCTLWQHRDRANGCK